MADNLQSGPLTSEELSQKDGMNLIANDTNPLIKDKSEQADGDEDRDDVCNM